MTSAKSKIIVFGASEGGRNFAKNQKEYDILAITDNDPQKHGTIIEGFQVVSPQSISTFDYDFVVIASMFVHQIRNQLTEELIVQPEKIKIALKSELKPSFRPFQDPKTLKFAREILFDLIEMFDEHNIKYFIDWGTLLGIVRDGDLISWDDDIDLTIHPNDIQNTISLLKENISILSSASGIKWTGSISYIEKDKPISIDLEFNSIELKEFTINIGFVYFENDIANLSIYHSKKSHYEKECIINFRGRNVRLPYKYEEHLLYTYGDWQTPRQQTTFGDVSLTFKEPERLFEKVKL